MYLISLHMTVRSDAAREFLAAMERELKRHNPHRFDQAAQSMLRSWFWARHRNRNLPGRDEVYNYGLSLLKPVIYNTPVRYSERNTNF